MEHRLDGRPFRLAESQLDGGKNGRARVRLGDQLEHDFIAPLLQKADVIMLPNLGVRASEADEKIGPSPAHLTPLELLHLVGNDVVEQNLLVLHQKNFAGGRAVLPSNLPRNLEKELTGARFFLFQDVVAVRLLEIGGQCL